MAHDDSSPKANNEDGDNGKSNEGMPYDPFTDDYQASEFNTKNPDEEKIDKIFEVAAEAAANRIVHIAEHSTNENLAFRAASYIVERVAPASTAPSANDPLTKRMEKMARRAVEDAGE